MKLQILKADPGNYWKVIVIDTRIEFIVETQEQAFALAIELAKTYGLPH